MLVEPLSNNRSTSIVSSSDSSDLLFSRERYEKRQGEVRLHMSHFFLRYLNDIYEAFEGDLAMAIVLGEISHHNTARFFSSEQTANQPLLDIQNDPDSRSRMDGCNAYSISCVTGIPRETVRRKIKELKNRGWLEDLPKRGLCFSKACADHFGADFSLRFLNGLLRASRHIEALLTEPEEGGDPEKGMQPMSGSARKPSTARSDRKHKPHSKSRKKSNS